MDIDKGQNDDMSNAVRLLNVQVRARGLPSMYTQDPTQKASKKRVRTADGDGAGGGGGVDHAQLRAHGYEVKSDVIVDDDGIEWEPISEVLVNPFLPVLRYADAQH
jgi:hypothetical protein